MFFEKANILCKLMDYNKPKGLAQEKWYSLSCDKYSTKSFDTITVSTCAFNLDYTSHSIDVNNLCSQIFCLAVVGLWVESPLPSTCLLYITRIVWKN